MSRIENQSPEPCESINVSDETNDNLDAGPAELHADGDPIDARALRFMVREMQADSPPVVDWSRLEERLLGALEPAGSHENEDLREPASAVQERPSLAGLIPTASSSHADIYVPETLLADEEAQEMDPRRAVSVPPARFHRFQRLGTFAAAAIVLVTLGFGLGRFTGVVPPPNEEVAIEADRWVDPTTVPLAEGMTNVYDLGALRAGDVVEASWGDLSFGRAGLMTWTLSAGSRLLVRSGIGVGEARHVVVLESGSLHAVVSDSKAKEDRFVVEAGDTRVSLFGGASVVPELAAVANISLTRSTKGLVVDVGSGTAAIANTSGREVRRLSEGERGTVSLDGGESFEALPPSAIRVERTSPAERTPPFAVANSVASPPRPLDEVEIVPRKDQAPLPSTSKPEVTHQGERVTDRVMTEASARNSLERCFADVEARSPKPEGRSPVSVTVRSTLSLGLLDDGTVKSAVFSPPLRAELQSCAVGLLKARFEPGRRTVAIPLELKK